MLDYSPPCGYDGGPAKPRTCSSIMVTCTQKRFSGPLLDCIAILMQVFQVETTHQGKTQSHL